jgi:signal transduction histidine kinase
LRIPSGSISTLLSLAAGAVAAGAVAAAWLPLVAESEQRELEAEGRRLEVLAHLGALRVRDGLGTQAQIHTPTAFSGLLEAFRAEASLPAVWLVGPGGAPLARAPGAEASGAGPGPYCGPGAPMELWIGDEQLRIACAPVPGALPTAWVAVLDTSGSAGPLARARRRATALMLGMGALVGLFVIGAIRWLLAPVQRVSQAAAAIAAGARGVRVQTDGPEEIAQLALAVNQLAGSVEAREDEIQGRIDVVTQLLSLVAHEVRNPLQSLSLLSALARTEPDAEARGRLLETMEREIHGLEGVVQRLLRSSGPVQISRADVDLVELLHRALAVAEPRARALRVNLMVQAPARLRAEVDGSLVRRTIENLLLNAVEFAAISPPGQVTATLQRVGEDARIDVDDDGPGVAPADRDRVFQPYYSSKPGGTGLGLALCKRVVDAHGGQIRHERSPLGGARFSATLPLRPPP